ncbi:hypothetical protein [Mesomycoplasma conjunctivae]
MKNKFKKLQKGNIARDVLMGIVVLVGSAFTAITIYAIIFFIIGVSQSGF